MVRLHRSLKIDAAPETVWIVWGDLAATHRWIPGIASARMEGLRRICRTQDGFEIVEEISDYSKEPRAGSGRGGAGGRPLGSPKNRAKLILVLASKE